mmetsp:Transcript_13663/g.33033  ORF Transcript_13663/g.33033 Transcript_13663/m.33033 type:complete len:336 (-) Transcript_13663:817-1824(-)
MIIDLHDLIVFSIVHVLLDKGIVHRKSFGGSSDNLFNWCHGSMWFARSSSQCQGSLVLHLSPMVHCLQGFKFNTNAWFLLFGSTLDQLGKSIPNASIRRSQNSASPSWEHWTKKVLHVQGIKLMQAFFQGFLIAVHQHFVDHNRPIGQKSDSIPFFRSNLIQISILFDYRFRTDNRYIAWCVGELHSGGTPLFRRRFEQDRKRAALLGGNKIHSDQSHGFRRHTQLDTSYVSLYHEIAPKNKEMTIRRIWLRNVNDSSGANLNRQNIDIVVKPGGHANRIAGITPARWEWQFIGRIECAHFNRHVRNTRVELPHANLGIGMERKAILRTVRGIGS